MRGESKESANGGGCETKGGAISPNLLVCEKLSVRRHGYETRATRSYSGTVPMFVTAAGRLAMNSHLPVLGSYFSAVF